jgi:hypothetical protein
MTTTTDLATRKAIRTVARRVLAAAVDMAIASGELDWDSYPEIGENDWFAVLTDVRALAERTDVQAEHYESAYRHLASRAEVSA